MGKVSSRISMRTNECYKAEHCLVGYVVPDCHTGVVIRPGHPEAEGFFRLQPGENGVVAFSSETFSIAEGSMDYTPLNLQAMCKLQAFLDSSHGFSALDPVQKSPLRMCWSFVPSKMSGEIGFRQLENWMIQQSIMSPRVMEPIAAVLRRTEFYWLVKFLIEQMDSSERLRDLGARYGVSVSHFRRLSRNALGNATKVELKSWRLAKALLDHMGSETSLTYLAMNHGYSSLSHFSNDVKLMFGVSPRCLKNVITSELKNEIFSCD